MDHFATDWYREFYRLLQKQGMYEKDVDEIEDDKLRDGFYAYFGGGWSDAKGITKEKLLKILRQSPSSLSNFLFPNEVLKEGLHVSSIVDYFLYPFISDMMYALPQGKGMEVNIKLIFGNIKKDMTLNEMAEWLGKRDLISSDFRVTTESGIYSSPPKISTIRIKGKMSKKEAKNADNP
jgi:hypothetical protein